MSDHTTAPRPDGSVEGELRHLNRRLVEALHAKCAMPVIPVPVPQDGGAPQPTALIGILLALWHQARAEADAYQAWIRQPAPQPNTDVIARDAEEAARAHLDTHATGHRADAEPQEHDALQHGRSEPPDGTCRRR